jgi:hypothetical protein
MGIGSRHLEFKGETWRATPVLTRKASRGDGEDKWASEDRKKNNTF